MKKYIAFLFWLPKFLLRKLSGVAHGYRKMIIDEPILGFLTTILLTMLLTIVTVVCFAVVFGKSIITEIAGTVALAAPTVYFISVQIQRLYSVFDQERRDTFDSLK